MKRPAGWESGISEAAERWETGYGEGSVRPEKAGDQNVTPCGVGWVLESQTGLTVLFILK